MLDLDLKEPQVIIVAPNRELVQGIEYVNCFQSKHLVWNALFGALLDTFQSRFLMLLRIRDNISHALFFLV